MKYISSIFSTGAVRKTPKRIVERILAEINFEKDNTFIELGAGNGEITIKVVEIKKQRQLTLRSYDAFEIDAKFSARLREKLPGINVITEDAFAFENVVDTQAKTDIIISSITLSFYPRPKIASLLERLKGQLAPNGKIIILYHAFWLTGMYKRILPGARVTHFATIPPYFLLVYNSDSKF